MVCWADTNSFQLKTTFKFQKFESLERNEMVGVLFWENLNVEKFTILLLLSVD